MINKIRDFSKTLAEELSYRDQIENHMKGLTATLWGLEEQSQYPENSGQADQAELSEQINACRIKEINCIKLIKSHDLKLVNLFESISKELIKYISENTDD